MTEKKDVVIISKDLVPAGRTIGTFTFLRDLGEALEEGQALQVKAKDAAEAKKLQNRWRAYFKKEAKTKKEVSADGKVVVVYFWRESIAKVNPGTSEQKD